jgi:hypothetical protein
MWFSLRHILANIILSFPTGIRSPHGWNVTEKSLEAKNVAFFRTHSKTVDCPSPHGWTETEKSLEAKNVALFMTLLQKRLSFPIGIHSPLAGL